MEIMKTYKAAKREVSFWCFR